MKRAESEAARWASCGECVSGNVFVSEHTRSLILSSSQSLHKRYLTQRPLFSIFLPTCI